VETEVIAGNIFSFTFNNDNDRRQVIQGGPWSFDKALLVLEEPTGKGDIQQMNFNKATFWVQIHRVPLLCMTADIVRFLGEMIGEVKDVDGGKTGDCVGKYVRVRVVINVNTPLRRILRVDVMGDGSESMMLLRYERLPDHCFQCGRLGYVVRDCPDGRGADGSTDFNLLYGAWLKASSPTKGGQFRSKRDGNRFGESSEDVRPVKTNPIIRNITGQLLEGDDGPGKRKPMTGTIADGGRPRVELGISDKGNDGNPQEGENDSENMGEKEGLHKGRVLIDKSFGESLMAINPSLPFEDNGIGELTRISQSQNAISTGGSSLESKQISRDGVYKLKDGGAVGPVRSIGPSDSTYTRQIIDDEIGLYDNFMTNPLGAKMDVDSGKVKVEIKDQNIHSLETSGGSLLAGNKGGVKTGKWKRWARDGVKHDNDMVGEAQLGKRAGQGGEDSNSAKFAKCDNGARVHSSDISAGRSLPACRSPLNTYLGTFGIWGTTERSKSC
jgi:hypothetical protein